MGMPFFSDESTLRMDSEMLESAFGAASNIVDMNGDGCTRRCQANIFERTTTCCHYV